MWGKLVPMAEEDGGFVELVGTKLSSADRKRRAGPPQPLGRRSGSRRHRRMRMLRRMTCCSSLSRIPMFTIMYADREGRIMHFFGGRTPVRAAGDYDWGGIVPGTGAATVWSRRSCRRSS